MSTDILSMQDCPFQCHIGITPEERGYSQPIHLDIEMHYDIRPAAGTDNLQDTIDYRQVHEAIRFMLDNTKFSLIETLAERVATIIQSQFSVQQVTVRLRKPGSLRRFGVAWTGVTIVRSA